MLGLDIRPNGIRFVDVSYGDEGMVLLNAGTWGIAMGEDRGGELTNLRRVRIKDALSGLLDTYKVASRRAAIALDSQKVIIKRTFLGGEGGSAMNLPEIARQVMSQEIGDSIPEYVVEYDLLEDSEGLGKEMIIAAARREVVEFYSELLNDVGLIPAVMDVRCFALQNAFEFCLGGFPEGSVAIADISSDFVELVVISSGKFRVSQTLPMPKLKDIRSLKQMGSSEGDELVSRGTAYIKALGKAISRRINGLARSSGISGELDMLALSGPGARIEDLRSYFEESYGDRLEAVNPFAKLLIEGDIGDTLSEASDYTIAVGLALRGRELS